MKFILKSMVSLLVLANHAAAAGDERVDSATSASRPVPALTYQSADDLLRDVALGTERLEQRIEVLALMAPENPELTKLNSMVAKVRAKLTMRQAQWEELKGTIEGVRLDMQSTDDSYLQECAQAERLDEDAQTMKPKYGPEQFINLANAHLQGRAAVVYTPNHPYTPKMILGLADQIFSTRQNISGLTETLNELEAEVQGFNT